MTYTSQKIYAAERKTISEITYVRYAAGTYEYRQYGDTFERTEVASCVFIDDLSRQQIADVLDVPLSDIRVVKRMEPIFPVKWAYKAA